jgi:hypothetical protein
MEFRTEVEFYFRPTLTVNHSKDGPVMASFILCTMKLGFGDLSPDYRYVQNIKLRLDR